MKRRKIIWIATALFVMLTAAWWLVVPLPSESGLDVHFLHYTNSTDGLSSDELEVYQQPQFMPPALPPVTHAVVQLANQTRSDMLLAALTWKKVGGGFGTNRNLQLDSMFAGDRRLPRKLASGDAGIVELKIGSTHGPWVAEVRHIQLTRFRLWLGRTHRHLPKTIQTWVRDQYLTPTATSVEFNGKMIPGSTVSKP